MLKQLSKINTKMNRFQMVNNQYRVKLVSLETSQLSNKVTSYKVKKTQQFQVVFIICWQTQQKKTIQVLYKTCKGLQTQHILSQKQVRSFNQTISIVTQKLSFQLQVKIRRTKHSMQQTLMCMKYSQFMKIIRTQQTLLR